MSVHRCSHHCPNCQRMHRRLCGLSSPLRRWLLEAVVDALLFFQLLENAGHILLRVAGNPHPWRQLRRFAFHLPFSVRLGLIHAAVLLVGFFTLPVRHLMDPVTLVVVWVGSYALAYVIASLSPDLPIHYRAHWISPLDWKQEHKRG